MVELSVIRDLVAIFGVIAGFSYYVLTVRANQRNQELALRAQEHATETRQAQMFMQIYNESHNDPSFVKGIHTLLDIVREHPVESYDQFLKIRENEQFRDAIQRVGGFYEGLGVLVREGFVSIRLVALLMTGMTRMWWEGLYKSWIEDGRKKANFPRWLSEAEYLYDELMMYIKEHPELAT
jgi:hypothetical protein